MLVVLYVPRAFHETGQSLLEQLENRKYEWTGAAQTLESLRLFLEGNRLLLELHPPVLQLH